MGRFDISPEVAAGGLKTTTRLTLDLPEGETIVCDQEGLETTRGRTT